MYLFFTDDGTILAGLYTRSTVGDVRNPKKYKPFVSAAICEDKDEELMYEDDSVKLMYNGLPFKPLFLMSEWKNNVSQQAFINCAMVLPSGVGKGGSRVKIIEDGEMLLLTVQWPVPLIDPKVLHRVWLRSETTNRIERCHPKIGGFLDSLKLLRRKKFDLVQSTARIPLPVPVQPAIKKDRMLFKEHNCNILYLQMTAEELEYAEDNDAESFTEV